MERRFTYQALRVVLEPISRNWQQHCFKILESFNLRPSGAVHRWSMVAILGVRLHLVPANPGPFSFVFSKKDQIARRRKWFWGVLQSVPLICKWALWIPRPLQSMLRGNAKFRIQSEISAAILTLTAGVGGNLASNCCCAFFKGNCFREAGSEVSATRFSRIESSQVG